MTPLSQALSAALLHFIWQGTVVAFLLWIALFLLRNRNARARYAASCAALALMAALPVITAWMVYKRPSGFSPSAAVSHAIPFAMNTIGAASRAWIPPLIGIAQQWALPVWAAGVLLFALRLALGYRHVSVLRRAGEVAEGAVLDAAAALARRMSLTRPVRVLVSRLADSPSVVGWLRPAILLPAAALAGLNADQLEAILAHEMAHILRNDFLVNSFQTVVEALLFYHPATWWVSMRIRQERELCCDDLAVHYCGDALGYARALTKLERTRMTPQPAVAANGGSLLYRVQRLTGAVRECAPSRLPVVLAIVAAAVCVPLTVHRAHAQDQAAGSVLAMPTEVTIQYDADQKTSIVFGGPHGYTTLNPDDGKWNVFSVEYPEAAVRQGLTGTVLTEATLDGEGHVVDAHVVTGPVGLRKAALQAVLDGHFVNATAGEVRQVTIDFSSEQLAAERARPHPGAVTLKGSTLLIDGPETANEEQLRTAVGELRQKIERIMPPRNEREEQRGLAVIESSGESILRNLQERLAGMQQIYGPHNPEIVTLRARIEAVQKQITRELAGRKLIRIEGDLPRDVQLPVQLGEVLTQDFMNQTIATLKEKAPYLDAEFLIAGENEMVIRIVRR